jgi:hypothetical protein
MNDFMKEELLVIAHDLGIVNDEAKTSYDHASSDFILRLRNKIQSMIDDYCEHTWNCNPYDFVLYCSNCGGTKNNHRQSALLDK